ncbi:MAG: methionine--tRNA ligase [Dictyoglomi bacterium]|nr:methionine--tRNA ligase [Dictyoglomota bacterium]
MGTYYVTTPIYYVNSKPHIGSAYTTILADTLARYHRLIGDDTLFLTGTDEHGVNIMRTAEKLGKHPKEFCDEVSAVFRKVFDTYNISYDRFIRTTDEDHEKVVQHVFKTMYEKGDIYKGEYRGFYCPKCETFYSPDELVDGKYCPIHGIEVEEVAEETYFFKWSKYQDALIKWYEEKKAIVPESRYNEIYTFVKNGLKDVSVTRITVPWGITVPIDPKHTVYVWFDALINYITGAGYPFDMDKFNKYWPHVRHILGKDILRHHAAMWPAMLMSLGIEPPHKLIVHGWWMMGGKKMSKSGGNIADPLELVKEVSQVAGISEPFAVDVIRYFVIIDGPQKDDKEFSMELLFKRYNSDLVNDYGNLIYRIVGFAKKKGISEVSPVFDGEYKDKLVDIFNDYFDRYRKAFDEDDSAEALRQASEFVKALNKYVDETKPWSAEPDVRDTIIYYVLDGIRLASLMLMPFIPTVATHVLELIGASEAGDWLDALQVGKLPRPVSIPVDMKPLFPRVDVNKYLKEIEKAEKKEEKKKEEKKVEENKVDIIEYDDFAKIDLRVGKIVEADKHPNADKLLLLKVDLGEGQPRTILAGIAAWYKPEELVGKEIIVVANLKPRKMRGIFSEGMLLAATDSSGKPVLLTPSEYVEPGAKVK